MQNEEGKVVELYMPRKCSATFRLIPAKEHGSCNINVGMVRPCFSYFPDERGIFFALLVLSRPTVAQFPYWLSYPRS